MKAFFTLKKRALTSGERRLAQQVFAESLKLDEISIVAHRLLLRHYAISPNGSIYFHPQDYHGSYSKGLL